MIMSSENSSEQVSHDMKSIIILSVGSQLWQCTLDKIGRETYTETKTHKETNRTEESIHTEIIKDRYRYREWEREKIKMYDNDA